MGTLGVDPQIAVNSPNGEKVTPRCDLT